MESGRKKIKKSMGLADGLQKRADVGAIGLMVIERGEKDVGSPQGRRGKLSLKSRARAERGLGSEFLKM